MNKEIQEVMNVTEELKKELEDMLIEESERKQVKIEREFADIQYICNCKNLWFEEIDEDYDCYDGDYDDEDIL